MRRPSLLAAERLTDLLIDSLPGQKGYHQEAQSRPLVPKWLGRLHLSMHGPPFREAQSHPKVDSVTRAGRTWKLRSAHTDLDDVLPCLLLPWR